MEKNYQPPLVTATFLNHQKYPVPTATNLQCLSAHHGRKPTSPTVPPFKGSVFCLSEKLLRWWLKQRPRMVNFEECRKNGGWVMKRAHVLISISLSTFDFWARVCYKNRFWISFTLVLATSVLVIFFNETSLISSTRALNKWIFPPHIFVLPGGLHLSPYFTGATKNTAVQNTMAAIFKIKELNSQASPF